MNKKRRSTNAPRMLLFRFRESVYYPFFVYGGIIVICGILIYVAVIPLIQNLFSVNKEVEATRARVLTLQQNIQFLTSLDGTSLDKQVSLANSAVPQIKDFAGALAAIGIAGGKNSVSIEDFQFQVGDVSKPSGKKSPVIDANPVLKIEVIVTGSTDAVRNFIATIKTELPLATITTLALVSGRTTIDINFASQPYKVKTINLAASPLQFSAKTQSVLQTVQQFQTNMQQGALQNQASQAGNLSPF